MAQKKYRCIHCGEEFTLSKEDQIDMDEGYIDTIPDTCDDCMFNINHPSYDIMDLHSDADPGL